MYHLAWLTREDSGHQLMRCSPIDAVDLRVRAGREPLTHREPVQRWLILGIIFVIKEQGFQYSPSMFLLFHSETNPWESSGMV